MEFFNNFEYSEKLDNLKTQIMKYISFKKRTEKEIRQKFENEDMDLLEDAIEYLKEAGYIDDFQYINRSINEFMALKNLSIKEISYKLEQKGISKSIVDTYICENKENMVEYEISSAKNIILKKIKGNTEVEDVKKYLFQKGYMSETVSIAFDELEDE